MQLSIEHNLSQEELRKAITGMAIGSGIEQEVLDTLLKASKGCDDTPKEPRTRAMRELYAAMQEQFRQAQEDIERYVEAITGIRKSQMAFDFNAPLHLEATTDKTGHVVHRWMADHHSAPMPSHKQEATNMEPTQNMERNGKDDFFKENQKTGYYLQKLEEMGCPPDLLALAKEITGGKKINESAKSEDGTQEQTVRWDKTELYYYSKYEDGFERLQITPDNGYVDYGQSHKVAAPADNTVVEQPQEAGMQTDIFYDKMTRTWICRVIDAEGNQIGDADYEPTKPLAQATAQRMLEEKTPKTPMTDLKDQLEAYKDKLQEQYIESVTNTLGWLQRLYGQNLREKNENTTIRNSTHYKVLENIGGATYRDTDGNYHIDPAAAADKGREYADTTIEAWHGKIMHKVKDLQSSTIHHLDGNRFIITGDRDGKKITIDQDMIINRSSNGTMFNQFPARIYVDGTFTSEAAYKKLTGDDAIEKQAKVAKDAEKRAKNMLPSGIFAKGDKVKLKLKRGEERYETEGTVLTERNGKTVVRYGANRFNMRDIGIETEKLARWNDK